MAQPEESEPNLSENESAEEQNTDVEIVNDSNNESLTFSLASNNVENESNVAEGEEEELEENVENEGVNVDGSIASSIQVASTASSAELEDDDELIIELGDDVIIDSKEHSRTIGTVYYRDFDIIRVKPYGSNNTVIDFELEQDEDGEDFKESEGVSF